MHTSLGLVALAGFFLAPSLREAPPWRPSYELARQEGQRAGKPLAVVIGSGARGFDALAEEGKLSRTTRKLLATHYVPVYVNADTPAGRKLARTLGIAEGTGIVLSDHTGELQAFNHDGTLTNEDLGYYLQRYADPDRVVRTTEGAESQEVSTDPPQEQAAPPQTFQPYVPVQSFVPAGFGGFGGGGRGGC